jgi:hypothetical protein
MSQEITHTLSLTVAKSPGSNSLTKSVIYDLTGNNIVSLAGQVATTTPAALDLSTLAQVQVMQIVNTGDTNNLIVSLASGSQMFSTLPPGGACSLMGCPTTIYIASDAATTEYAILAAED